MIVQVSDLLSLIISHLWKININKCLHFFPFDQKVLYGLYALEICWLSLLSRCLIIHFRNFFKTFGVCMWITQYRDDWSVSFIPNNYIFTTGENFSRSTLWTNLSNIFLTSNKSSVRCVNQSSLCETFTTEKKLVRESLYSTISSASVLFSQTFFAMIDCWKYYLRRKKLLLTRNKLFSLE